MKTKIKYNDSELSCSKCGHGNPIPRDWKKAQGIVYDKRETNSAFAQRNYDESCSIDGTQLAIYEGYHIWWCSSHYQPLSVCEIEKLKIKISNAALKLIGED